MMKINFKEQDPQKIVAELHSALGGRKLASILDLSLVGKDIHVTIKKLGTSTLEFTHNPSVKSGLEWELSAEKIALTHKAFKTEMIAKLTKIIENIGGVVS